MTEALDPARCAASLREALAMGGKARRVCDCHLDGRDFYEWWYRFPVAPGLVRVERTPRRGGAHRIVYRHDCLPGWEYSKREIVTEMLPDLERLARGEGPPAEATRAA